MLTTSQRNISTIPSSTPSSVSPAPTPSSTTLGTDSYNELGGLQADFSCLGHGASANRAIEDALNLASSGIAAAEFNYQNSLYVVGIKTIGTLWFLTIPWESSDISTGSVMVNQSAASNTQSLSYPLDYFFTAADGAVVASNFQSAVNAIVAGGGQSIYLSCGDDDTCTSRNLLAYFRPATTAYPQSGIKLCNAALALPSLNTPCTKQPDATISIGHVVLHELLRMQNASVQDTATGLSAAVNLSLDGNGMVENADNYAYFADWAYELGFKQDSQGCLATTTHTQFVDPIPRGDNTGGKGYGQQP